MCQPKWFFRKDQTTPQCCSRQKETILAENSIRAPDRPCLCPGGCPRIAGSRYRRIAIRAGGVSACSSRAITGISGCPGGAITSTRRGRCSGLAMGDGGDASRAIRRPGSLHPVTGRAGHRRARAPSLTGSRTFGHLPQGDNDRRFVLWFSCDIVLLFHAATSCFSVIAGYAPLGWNTL